MSAPRRQRYMPWRDPLPSAGPVVIVDIDGVIATMKKFEPLLGESFSPQGWREFNKRYKYAALINRGARLVDLTVESGLQVVYSTTRPDSAAEDTWNWLGRHQLPKSHIMTRHRIKDGTRPAVDVKLRHFFQWRDKYGDVNPIAAWIDDADDALHALPDHGCPTWHPMRLQRVLNRSHGADLLATLFTQVNPPMPQLEANFIEHRAKWDVRDHAFQAQQSVWWEKEKLRMAAQRDAQRSRQQQGRLDADRRRR